MSTFPKRTHTCGQLRAEHVGHSATLLGWVNRVRDMGGFVFIDLRDREGKTQLLIDPQTSPEAAELARKLRNESCLAASGTVRARLAGQENLDLPTGGIELSVERLVLLNPSEVLPFQIDDHQNVAEELRLEYRFLDLRRPALQRLMTLRHRLAQQTRRFLDEQGFLEIETPVLTRSTPEGARDYLVPNRREAGTFFALPQSPQLFKQLLMVAGYDKYFQIVRCFRDEDLRADRQPEFTQIDIEMSFVDMEDVISMNEGLFSAIYQAVKGTVLPQPFRRMSYDEAMVRYGSDKPDLRLDLELTTLDEAVAGCDFKVFTGALEQGGHVVGLTLPGRAEEFSRKRVDDLTNLFKTWGGGGLAWFKLTDGILGGSAGKFFTGEAAERLIAALGLTEGGIAFVGAGPSHQPYKLMGQLRLHLGHELGLVDTSRDEVLWVVDFPLLDWNPDEQRWDACHHPFTHPHPDDLHLLETDPGKVRALAYDLVLNGIETAGGSIRIHRKEVQDRVFRLLGISAERANERFGFLLKALQYGAPPHGGIAYGFDRMVMTLGGTENIREVIAFPKNLKSVCPLTQAPSSVDAEQLVDLHIQVKPKESPQPDSAHE